MCGENRAGASPPDLLKGSPPRVRGKPRKREGRSPPLRITPACAGKTPAPGVPNGTVKDHPRVCGENLLILSKDKRIAGSPPRVRGKQACLANILNESRITPACAGKTFSYRKILSVPKDHPRVCGENHLPEHIGRIREGSPPRVRGKPA